MPKLDLRNAIRIKGAGGEINALKGQGFSWTKPSGDVDPILAYFQSTGANGAYYTPWDKSTLFQDTAGTIPVVNDGDPVGLMLDASGNGRHLTQTISASRPLYKTDGVYHWILFDGVDDHLVNTSFNLNNPSEFSHFSSVIVTNNTTVIPYAFTNSGQGSGVMPILRTSGDFYTDRYSNVDIDRSDQSYFNIKLTVSGRLSTVDNNLRSVVNGDLQIRSGWFSVSTSNGFSLGRQTTFYMQGRYYGGGSIINTIIPINDLENFRIYIDSKGTEL